MEVMNKDTIDVVQVFEIDPSGLTVGGKWISIGANTKDIY